MNTTPNNEPTDGEPTPAVATGLQHPELEPQPETAPPQITRHRTEGGWL